MKTRILVAVALILLVSTIAVSAAGVVASVTPSNPMPLVGQAVNVTFRIAGNGVPVGSFGATLVYDPTILRYESDGGILGMTGVVNATKPGRLVFNGVNIQGMPGTNDVLAVKFTALKAGVTPLDLTITSMSEAKTFAGIIPQVNDGQVWVRGAQLWRR
jgi:hypothetical protein